MKIIPEAYRKYPLTTHNFECYFICGRVFLVVHVCFASWESYTHSLVNENKLSQVSRRADINLKRKALI